MNSKNNQVDGLLQNALGVAKKLSSSSLDALNKVAQNQKKSQSSMQLPEQNDQMPNLSQQLLGVIIIPLIKSPVLLLQI